MANAKSPSIIRPVARGLRVLGAGLILANGGLHFYLWRQTYRAIPVIGPLFLLNAVAAVLIAAGLLWKPKGIAALLGVALSAGTFGGFVLASTVGLFGFSTGWSGQAVIAAVVETGAIVVLIAWWSLTKGRRGAASFGERAEDAAEADSDRQRSA